MKVKRRYWCLSGGEPIGYKLPDHSKTYNKHSGRTNNTPFGGRLFAPYMC